MAHHTAPDDFKDVSVAHYLWLSGPQPSLIKIYGENGKTNPLPTPSKTKTSQEPERLRLH